jgi:hypothetical protein
LAIKITFCVRGVVSSLLANVYLHYVFDLWADVVPRESVIAFREEMRLAQANWQINIYGEAKHIVLVSDSLSASREAENQESSSPPVLRLGDT